MLYSGKIINLLQASRAFNSIPNINFNSLYEIFNVNKNNDELLKENNELKTKLKLNKTLILNIYSLVKDFNNKFENIINDFKKILEK